MDDWARKHKEIVVNNLTFYLSPQKSVVKFSEISNIDGLNRAIDCALYMQRYGLYDNQKVGVLNPEISELGLLNGFVQNQVVLYTPEISKCVTVYVPYSLEAIKAQQSQGSRICSSVIVNVPSNYISKVIR